MTWASRTEEHGGKTSPEELIAAAHASCFRWRSARPRAGRHAPERLETSATLTFVPGEGITKSALTVVGTVPGLDAGGIREAAEAAKDGCPVSGALDGNVELTLDARLHRLKAWPRAPGMEQLVDELERNYRETQERMSDPAVYNDHREAAEVGRRLKELETPYKLAERWRSAAADLGAARSDAELAEMVPEYEAEIERLEEELKLALVETDPADSKDVILEVRQGVGGDEAALWAAEVTRMLQRYAERRGFKTETLSTSESEAGGIKETVLAVKGDGAYSVFKWEGGTHRVQRVPVTESQGRIHTSTATVAVMPEAEEVEIDIDENDLKIDVYRSTGPAARA